MFNRINDKNKLNTNFYGHHQKEKMYDLCIQKSIEKADTTIYFPEDLLNKINNL